MRWDQAKISERRAVIDPQLKQVKVIMRNPMEKLKHPHVSMRRRDTILLWMNHSRSSKSVRIFRAEYQAILLPTSHPTLTFAQTVFFSPNSVVGAPFRLDTTPDEISGAWSGDIQLAWAMCPFLIVDLTIVETKFIPSLVHSIFQISRSGNNISPAVPS
jgi:hypothetical protein